MHRDLPSERRELGAIAGRFEPDDDANSAKPVSDRPVHVMANRAFAPLT